MNDPGVPISAGVDVRKLARKVVLTRAQFTEIYDRLAAGHGGDEMQLVSLFADEDDPPFYAAFVEAERHGWLKTLLRALLSVSGFNEPGEPHVSPAAVVQLQGMVSPITGMVDVGQMTPGYMAAVRRVCLVVVKNPMGERYGTGFLVGPQVILTSWHVVKPLLDDTPECQPLPGSAEKLTIYFDKTGDLDGKPHKVAQQWLVNFSKAHMLETGADVAINDHSLSNGVGFESHLDFALILLAKPVGRQRGFYTLDPRRKPKVSGDESKIFAFQHPAGMSMKISDGNAVQLWPTEIEARLKHTANTMSGSSGGLIVGPDFEPVALHQCGILGSNGKVVVNGAIPTAWIATNDHRFDMLDGVDELWETTDGHPVFGRGTFQELVLRALTGQLRILVVRGPALSGKSFSGAILRAMLGVAEHLIVDIPTDIVSHDPLKFVRALLQKLGASDNDLADLPQESDAETTLPAWIKDVLFPQFLVIASRLAARRTVWLTFDDLEKHPPANGGSLGFLELLYHRIEQVPFLRIVLLGQQGTVPSPTALTAYERIVDVSPDEVELCLVRHLVAKGRSPASAKLVAAMIYAAVSAEANFSIKILALHYMRIVPKLVLEGHFNG